MATIHVIYDPKDTVAMPPPDRMERMQVQAVCFRLLKEPEPQHVEEIVAEATKRIMTEVTR